MVKIIGRSLFKNYYKIYPERENALKTWQDLMENKSYETFELCEAEFQKTSCHNRKSISFFIEPHIMVLTTLYLDLKILKIHLIGSFYPASKVKD